MKINAKYFNLNSFLLVIIVLYMINNLEHSTYVYYTISKKQLSTILGWEYADWLQSIIVIIVLDLSVIAWVRLGRYWEAGIFEFLILIINLLYYQWALPGLWEYNEFVYHKIAEFLFAAMFTYGVISFAKIYSDKIGKKDVYKLLLDQHESLKIEVKTAFNSIFELRVELEENESEIMLLQSHVNSLETTLQLAEKESIVLDNTIIELKNKLSRKKASENERII